MGLKDEKESKQGLAENRMASSSLKIAMQQSDQHFQSVFF
jgi:hypothetical protein